MGVTECLFLVALAAFAGVLIWLERSAGVNGPTERLSPLAFYTPPGSFPVFFPVYISETRRQTLNGRKRLTVTMPLACTSKDPPIGAGHM